MPSHAPGAMQNQRLRKDMYDLAAGVMDVSVITLVVLKKRMKRPLIARMSLRSEREQGTDDSTAMGHRLVWSLLWGA